MARWQLPLIWSHARAHRPQALQGKGASRLRSRSVSKPKAGDTMHGDPPAHLGHGNADKQPRDTRLQVNERDDAGLWIHRDPWLQRTKLGHLAKSESSLSIREPIRCVSCLDCNHCAQVRQEKRSLQARGCSGKRVVFVPILKRLWKENYRKR